MVKKMLEVVVNYLYPALTTVKTDWLFLCTPDSVMFAASRPLAPPPDASPVPSPHRPLPARDPLHLLRGLGQEAAAAAHQPRPQLLLRLPFLGCPGACRRQRAIQGPARPAWPVAAAGVDGAGPRRRCRTARGIYRRGEGELLLNRL